MLVCPAVHCYQSRRALCVFLTPPGKRVNRNRRVLRQRKLLFAVLPVRVMAAWHFGLPGSPPRVRKRVHGAPPRPGRACGAPPPRSSRPARCRPRRPGAPSSRAGLAPCGLLSGVFGCWNSSAVLAPTPPRGGSVARPPGAAASRGIGAPRALLGYSDYLRLE